MKINLLLYGKLINLKNGKLNKYLKMMIMVIVFVLLRMIKLLGNLEIIVEQYFMNWIQI